MTVSRKQVAGLARASALSAALTLAGGAIPFIGAIAMMAAPLPILMYAIGRSAPLSRALGAVALAAVLISIAAGTMAGLAYMVSFGVATLLICYLIERQQPFELIVLLTSAAVLIAGTLMALAAAGSPAALAKLIQDSMSAAMARSGEIYRLVGVDPAVEERAKALMIEWTLRFAPALAALTVASGVLFNLWSVWRWLGRERFAYDLFGDLSRWSAPEWLIWALLTSGFALFVPFGPARQLAADVFICVLAAYFCQGLAIAAFYLKMLSMPAVARGIIYFVTMAQPVIAALVSIVGVFDLWVDFRRLKRPTTETGSFGDFF